MTTTAIAMDEEPKWVPYNQVKGKYLDFWYIQKRYLERVYGKQIIDVQFSEEDETGVTVVYQVSDGEIGKSFIDEFLVRGMYYWRNHLANRERKR